MASAPEVRVRHKLPRFHAPSDFLESTASSRKTWCTVPPPRPPALPGLAVSAQVPLSTAATIRQACSRRLTLARMAASAEDSAMAAGL